MDKLLTRQSEKYKELYQKVVDLKFVFEDAINVKREENSIQEETLHAAESLGYWDNAELRLNYLKAERGIMQFFRDSFILVMKTAIAQVGTKKWAKSNITSFIKDIYFSKEGFFTKDQIEELDKVMEDLNTENAQSTSKFDITRKSNDIRHPR